MDSSSTLKDQVNSWIIDKTPLYNNVELPKLEALRYPDYSIKFYTPITVQLSSDSTFSLCMLNFQEYSKAPHAAAMFKDLVKISNCHSPITRSFSEIDAEIQNSKGTPAGRVLKPTGFIFHESRVGSTLIANLLGSDPMNLVFSESEPPSTALLRCSGCSHSEHVQRFRDVVTVMGRSPIHDRLFFKFQSITTTKIKIALDAFPDVPWVFVFRQPVQTMMSHVDPSRGSSAGAPCLRSKSNPPPKVSKALVNYQNPPNEAWCAAHLNMLCEEALEAFQSHGTYGEQHSRYLNEDGSVYHGRQRSMLVNYESLPGIIPKVVLPMFGVNPSSAWVSQMAHESTQYSKGRGGSRVGVFVGDAERKDKGASESIKSWAKDVLQPSYEKLSLYAEEAVKEVGTVDLPRDSSNAVVWSQLKSISVESSGQGVSSSGNVRKLKPNDDPFNTEYNSSAFEVFACPDTPAPGYPRQYPIKSILDNWNTDSAVIPPRHYDAICKFDYQTEYAKALAYRNAEVPFVVYNIPEVEEVVRKWKDPDYLNKKLGPNKKYKCEKSEDNHFMYWKNVGNAAEKFTNLRTGTGQWEKPTDHAMLTFNQWLLSSVTSHNKSINEIPEHYYFRATAMGESGESGWLFDELTFFQPKKSLFIVDPSQQRGIHCRFGMKSVIAESHFDGSRNMAASLGGLRRWILNSPDQCEHMHLLPKNHPSGRHSEVDWSKPDYDRFPNFHKLHANELIVRAGDVLYLPTAWFHYIISLNTNYQCNTRSGVTSESQKYIKKCGF